MKRDETKFTWIGRILVIVAALPLLLGGWTISWVSGDPALPKALSQFRNPLLAFFAVALLLALFSPSARRRIIRELRSIATPRNTLLLLVIGTLAFVKASFLDYAALSLNAIDLSVYDSAMRSTLEGRFMQAVTGVNHFGVHATPILLLLLPFHAMFGSPLFVVFLHPLALGLGAFLLDRILRQEKIEAAPRFWIVFAYFACTLVSKTLHYGFHVEVFYPAFGFLLFLAIGTRTACKIFVALLLFLSIKEDAPFYAVGILVASLVTGRISKREAALFGGVSVAVAVFYLSYLIPANTEDGAYRLAHAAAKLGSTPGETVKNALTDPIPVLRNVFRGGWWPLVLPALGLLAQSPFFWIASIPFVAIYSLAGNDLMLGLGLYYGIPWVPIFFMGWIEGFGRDPLPKRANFFLVLAVVGTSLVGSGYLVFRKTNIADWVLIRRMTRDLASGGIVCAPGILYPQLPYSPNNRLLSPDRIPECFGSAHRIVLPTDRDPYPLSATDVTEIETSLRADSAWLEEKEIQGVATEPRGFRVYRRP